MSPWQPHVFGVRHLSPCGAWHLGRFLDRVRPRAVLIEGISDASSLIPHIVEATTRPPIAILAYTDSVPVRTLIYPLARYSPEYQAMRWAHENDAEVELIDLPSDVFLGLQDLAEERGARLRATEGRKGEVPGESPEEGRGKGPDSSRTDGPFEETRSIYVRVAERAGEPDYDTYWERRFEHNLAEDSYRRAVFELGRALRDEEDPLLWRAENLVREAYMRRRVEEVLARGVKPEEIVVVVGAFHAPVIRGECPAMTDQDLASLRRRSSKLTLMPYSYFKLSTQSGYGAGNRAPAYFELLWEALESGDLHGLPVTYLSQVARHLRERGIPRSTADVIEGVRLARTLSALHEGLSPTLQDLRDGAVTLMGHGELSQVSEALSHVNVGTSIGELAGGVCQTSIQSDFDRWVRHLKLEKYRTTVKQELVLDLRENRQAKSEEAAFLDLNRSSFFHRLLLLGIGFGTPASSRQRSTTWEERWHLQWSPECEIALVEAVLLGETVELATAFKMKTLLEETTTIGEAGDRVHDACLCGLMSSLEGARARLQELSVVSSDLKAVAHATFRLSQVVRFGDVRRFDPSPLLPLLEELFVQGCLALFGAANCDNQGAQELMISLDELNRVSLEDHDRIAETLWLDQLKRLGAADNRNPLLSGFACAVLLERGLLTNEELAREVARRLSPGIPADLGAGWFEGLSRRNRFSLLGRQPLWEALATYIQSLDEDQFRRALVFLRRAFGVFSPQEKRHICENLGSFWGIGADEASERIEQPLTEQEKKSLEGLNDFDFDDL